MSMIGKTLGAFECTALIGKGGMGEVYKAKDQKLGRDVAIKVLPEEFAKDADRVARFQREAKLLASLNHPNIASIYGLEESDETHFLVLELIEGDTLADRLKRGAIPVEESLKLALQIAEALKAAHEKGVIHRDLKPANIKVTPDGKVKVLDFGLAKAFAGEQAEVNLSHSPTLSEAATLQGVILGTAAYMSPEQARGKPIDKRTDIWAFGCVLYEMLTGKAAFQGEDVTEILAAVVKSGVNLDLLPAKIHPRINELLTRCLQKDPKRRYSGISDVQYDIEQVLADPSGVLIQQAKTIEPQKRLGRALPWVIAVILVGIVVGIITWKLKPTEPRQFIHFSYDLSDGQQFTSTGLMPIAVSPDGRQFAFSTTEGIYLRSVEEWNARLIVGLEENPIQPFFSPNGEWIGYWSAADQQLKKIAVSGGAPSVLCETAVTTGARWYPDKTIIFSSLDGIMRISDNGGIPETLLKRESLPEAPFFPQLLPDGESLLFTTGSELQPEGSQKVFVLSLESGEVKGLFNGKAAQYLPTGHLIYRSKTSLYAVPFDIDTLKTTGGSASVVEDVLECFVSDSGMLAYIPGITSPTLEIAKRTLVLVDREGNEETLPFPPDSYAFPRISPDGTKVALVIGDPPNPNIWILGLARATRTPLTFDETSDWFPLWTPDGKRIVFYSVQEGETGVYWKAASGTGEAELLVSVQDKMMRPSSWASDGKTLVLDQMLYTMSVKTMATMLGALLTQREAQYLTSSDFQQDIVLLSVEGNQELEPLLEDKFFEFNPQLSPDGRRIAYASNESGQDNVYMRPYPEVNSDKSTVSTSGGYDPRWSVAGAELFYRSGDAIMGVNVDPGTIQNAGQPQRLFQGNYYSFWNGQWDIHPDGRFLMIKPPDAIEDESPAAGPRQINFVTNWFEELKERVPAP